MAEQPASAEHYKGRAVRYRVGEPFLVIASPLAIAYATMQRSYSTRRQGTNMAFAGLLCARYSTASSVSGREVQCQRYNG